LVLIYPDLSLIVSGFHEGVNLISFSLAEVFVFHKQLRLPGQENLIKRVIRTCLRLVFTKNG
jgi:hypothetical protein